MLPVPRDLQPLSYGRLGFRATLVGLAGRRVAAAATTAGLVIGGHARLRHLPQTERVDQGELREPEAGPLEHLQGLFSHVVSGRRKGVRVAVSAVGRILETLCERHFQREVEVIYAAV